MSLCVIFIAHSQQSCTVFYLHTEHAETAKYSINDLKKIFEKQTQFLYAQLVSQFICT